MVFGPRAGPRLSLAVGVVAVAAAGTAASSMLKKTFHPSVLAKPTTWNQALIALCPHLSTPYTLPALLNNGHVETIFAALFRRRPHVLYDRELLHMPDGGVVALDTEKLPESPTDLPADAPVVIILPGLTGGSEDSYVQHAIVHARAAGIRAVVFNSRGTSDSPVTTPQFYSASFTDDLRCVVAHVAAQYPEAMLFAAGWSLGANILTRYLGEEGKDTPLRAAVAMCNPFNLPLSNENFSKGFNRIYDWNLAKSLRRIYAKHHDQFENAVANGAKHFNPTLALNAKTIRDFDEAITAGAFGWPSVDAYYAGSSSSLSIPNVAVPLLVVQAEDDPIAPKEGIPYATLSENPNCVLVTTPTGGHLGWCFCGSEGVLGAPWTDRAVIQYFLAVQKLGAAEKGHPAEAEKPGVYTMGTTTHQAP